MAELDADDVTQLLLSWGEGDESALNRLIPLVYAELRRIASNYMKRERPGHTLQTTALVNEAYLRLVDLKKVHWQNRAQFFALSAQLIRHVLVDFARSHCSAKRGGTTPLASLEEACAVSAERGADLVALDHALHALSRVDDRKAQVVELRFFGGMSVTETAEALKVSAETVARDWRLAKV